MKQTKKFLQISFAACLLAILSCNSVKEEPEYVPVEHQKEETVKKSGYYCPMECEGDKTYTDSTIKCPVCDMKMVATK